MIIIILVFCDMGGVPVDGLEPRTLTKNVIIVYLLHTFSDGDGFHVLQLIEYLTARSLHLVWNRELSDAVTFGESFFAYCL